jgi:DnaJ-class molecular chaperone
LAAAVRPTTPRKGSNLRIKVKLTLQEIANGVEKNKSQTQNTSARRKL